MRVNKIAACVLGATLLLQSSTLTYAQDQTLPILTLETAIKQATTRNLEPQTDNLDHELSIQTTELTPIKEGDCESLSTKMQQAYLGKKGIAIEQRITLDITQLFDRILIEEEKQILNEHYILLTAKEIEKSTIDLSSGLMSELDLQTLKLKQKQLEQEKVKSKKNLELLYEQLNQMMGTSSKQYILDKGETHYTPYQEVESIQLFAADKVEEHLSLWRSNEALSVAHEIPSDKGNEHTALSQEADREYQVLEVTLTEHNIEQAIKQAYVNIKQLETAYEIAKENLSLQEKQLKVNKVYLEKGLMSQLSYDKSVFSYEQEQLHLMKLESQHTTLAYQLDHPHLMGVDIY